MDRSGLEQYRLTWESRSSLRTRPAKQIDFSLPGDFFSRDKQVLLCLPEIASFGEKKIKEILVLSLYKYLKDIVQLESKWIYSACDSIIYKDLSVKFLDMHKLNACTIVMDEYYHIYIAYDLLLQLRTAFPHLPELESDFSDSYHAVQTIKNKLDVKFHEIFEILAVCIFETTLIRELVSYFDSATVHPCIKYYMNDHMNDESRHFGFFYGIFCHVWEQMSDEYKQAIGAELGNFVSIYLNVGGEIKYNKNILNWVFNDAEKANTLITKLYVGFTLSPDIPIVKNVLNVLNKAGVLNHKAVRDGFKKNGLLSD